jgi:hypothetical protein
MANAKAFCDRRLELLQIRPVVRQPLPIEQILKSCQKARTISQVGSANMKGFGKQRVLAGHAYLC